MATAQVGNISYVTRPISNVQKMFNFTFHWIKMLQGAQRHHITIKPNGDIIYQYGQATTFTVDNSTGKYTCGFSGNYYNAEDSSYIGNSNITKANDAQSYNLSEPLYLSTTMHVKSAKSTVQVQQE